MTVTALLNGEPASTLAVTDRGLSYGDGIFRTVLVHRGKPVAWPFHWQRLQHDCERLDLAVPSESCLLEECNSLFTDGGGGVLKIIVTRGSGGRGYSPPEPPGKASQTRLLMRYPLPEVTNQAPVELGVCSLRLGRNPRLAGIKHLNRLEQVLARQECANKGWQEALLLDANDWVISGTMSNLFIVKDKQLITPKLDQAGVIGATRQRILQAAENAGYKTQEQSLKLGDCINADEIFMCNSLKGVWPVSRLDDSSFSTAAVTRHCQALIQNSEMAV